ncbi:MAG: hypothetical protein HPY44_08300 [Armatimonadetes bacterium]|nr:hypothetical protein [Armatimonadota bacterium]
MTQTSGFSLNDGNCPELLGARVPHGRRAEIRESLKAIHRMFLDEQAQGLVTLQKNWRAWTTLHLPSDYGEVIDRTVTVAERIRGEFEVFVHVGIGGSDLGPRVCHEVLNSTLYNELPPEIRGAPRVYFAGDTFDPRPLRELLAFLESRGELHKTVFNIVSKSGKTPETLCAFLAIKDRLGPDWVRQMVFTTGEVPGSSILYDLAAGRVEELVGLLPVPDGVGGRFSVPSPVGLLPLAVTAGVGETPRGRIESALRGYGMAHEAGLKAPFDQDGNPNLQNFAFRLATWLQYAEEQGDAGTLVLYDYSACRMLGDWLVQLYTESIQERGAGLNVTGARGPTSNHSLLNGVVNGPRDKVILFVDWQDMGEDLYVPADSSIEGSLQTFMNRQMTRLNRASFEGTFADFRDQGVPALAISCPDRSAESLFFLMRVLMDAVAVKGRLQSLHIDRDWKVNPPKELTYQQEGVEGYKEAMRRFLADS